VLHCPQWKESLLLNYSKRIYFCLFATTYCFVKRVQLLIISSLDERPIKLPNAEYIIKDESS
jgi:hypothetical protein